MSGVIGFLLGLIVGLAIATIVYYKLMKVTYRYVKAQEMTINTANSTINYVGKLAKKVKKWQKK